jgi:hypothetical protein
LVSKHASSSGTRAVGFGNAMGINMTHEIFILASDGAHKNSVISIRGEV